MLKHLDGWVIVYPTIFSNHHIPSCRVLTTTTGFSVIKARKLRNDRVSSVGCDARRRVRYEDEDEDNGDEEYGYNEEIAILELYSQSARGEALIVHALVDDQEVEVIIFKGFSSSLSYGTSSDPSRSVLPARAVIKFIDRIEGPFDPSNIVYIEKGISWEAFRSRDSKSN